jgi:hypothetical protein
MLLLPRPYCGDQSYGDVKSPLPPHRGSFSSLLVGSPVFDEPMLQAAEGQADGTKGLPHSTLTR